MEFLITGIIAGMLIGFLIGRYLLMPKNNEAGVAETVELEKQNAILNEKINSVNQNIIKAENELQAERERNNHLNELKGKLETQCTLLEKQLLEQKAELTEIQQKFKTEFENLASKILEEKTQKFTEQNKNNLDIILNPLKEQIKEFGDKVDKTYKAEAAERNSLKGEIKSLVDLNKQISQEANNLAKALKGDTKKQGNWGEIILEKVLERSGLQKDVEYKTQVSTLNDEGKRIQPDVVVFLPENKHIIIDSKVSLVAYEAFVNASSEEEKAQYISEHIGSVKSHIKGLSEKKYQHSEEFSSPDFVLLFMPIESSFSLAIQADNEIFGYAWERNIVIVSPTTLLATLRTISSLWKQERQTKNTLEIAKQGGALYDKFVGFTEDLVAIGKSMDSAKLSYEAAMKKISTGTGNLIKRTEELKKLGAKATKSISQPLIERSNEE
jgi:DNA recombination protein RmuC